jgi:magnesium-protoporphyrin O-methyltransferase
MTGCCARHGQEELFGEKTAARDARRYRKRGPDAMARSLARRAAARGIHGATVTEIGGGIGQVLLELLQQGAASGEVVELLPTYEPHFRALAQAQGVADRVSYRTADLVVDRGAGAPSDVVVLNKVVCCTPDGVELAGIAAGLARRTLVLSHPREAWWVRAGGRTANAVFRLIRRRFRLYLHPAHALDEAVTAHGFALASQRDGPLFRIAAFERAPSL